jgi:hypothetical protein
MGCCGGGGGGFYVGVTNQFSNAQATITANNLTESVSTVSQHIGIATATKNGPFDCPSSSSSEACTLTGK